MQHTKSSRESGNPAMHMLQVQNAGMRAICLFAGNLPGIQRQSPNVACHNVSAATAAVSARRIRGPRLTGTTKG